MTAPKRQPTVVVAPEPFVLNAAALAGRLGCEARYVREHLEFDDGAPASVKDVPAEIGDRPSVWFDVGGGVKVAIFRGPSGAICCFRRHVDDAIAEAEKRWTHPSVGGER